MKRPFKHFLPTHSKMSSDEIRTMFKPPPPVDPERTALADRLVATFDGAIKYTPMVKDHPDWTYEQCLEFARKWHEVAIDRLRTSYMDERGCYRTGAKGQPWNNLIPYCRNEPNAALLKEAGKA